jgi:Calcineurin-like phosphoesterase/Effector-associated domain 1
MNPELTLRDLRIALAGKYSDETSIRRVAFDIRLNTIVVAFSGSSADVWRAMLEAVEKQGKFEALFMVALEEYPDLKEAVDAYRAGHVLTVPPERSPVNLSLEQGRRTVSTPEALEVTDTALTILHVSDMQFGKNHRFGPGELLQRTLDDLEGLRTSHHLKPDLLIVTGDLAEWGMKSEFDQSLEFINGLLEHLELGADRAVIIPGNHDINRSHCSAYFEECKGDGQNPLKPYGSPAVCVQPA